MGKYYLVTGEGHELESFVLKGFVLKGTGEVDGGYIRVGLGGDTAWVLEEDLTRITSDDFHTVLMQTAYGETDRLDALCAAIADGTY